MRTALDAGEVQVALGKATERFVQCARLSRIAQHEQERSLDGGSVIRFRKFWQFNCGLLDRVETREVYARQVFEPLLENVKAIELGGVSACDSANVLVAALGDFFGTACGIVKSSALDVRVLAEKAAALRETLRMAQHFGEVFDLCARQCAKRMFNLQLDFGNNRVTPLVKQVVVVVNGTGGRVLDRNGAAIDNACLDALENLFEGVHRHDFDIVTEKMICGTFTVGSATALKCDFLHSAKYKK